MAAHSINRCAMNITYSTYQNAPLTPLIKLHYSIKMYSFFG